MPHALVLPRRPAAAATLALLAAAALARPAAAQLGSGTVSFTFTSFTGPMAVSTQAASGDPTQWPLTGLVNDVAPTPTGAWVTRDGVAGGGGYVIGTHQFTTPATSVNLRYTVFDPTSPVANILSFAARPFTNVAVGQDFVLGTLTFQNGGWFGSGATAALNTPTDLGFRITTTSASGAQFNQTIVGSLRMTVNAPDNNDVTTLPGQEAEADWVHLTGPAVVAGAGAFRVFDDCCKPAGFTNVGSVDVIARFGSLDLVGFASARGGFITPGVNPLPPNPVGPGTVVPEPSTWALLGVGLAALAGGVRRTGVSRTRPGRAG